MCHAVERQWKFKPLSNTLLRAEKSHGYDTTSRAYSVMYFDINLYLEIFSHPNLCFLCIMEDEDIRNIKNTQKQNLKTKISSLGAKLGAD